MFGGVPRQIGEATEMTTLTTDTITIEITRGVQRSETQWALRSATGAECGNVMRVLNPDNQWRNRGTKLYGELKRTGKMTLSIEEAQAIATQLEAVAGKASNPDMTPRRRTGALRAAKTIRDAIATS